MQRIGVPVPDGFTVTTEACVDAMKADGDLPAGLWEGVLDRLAALEERTGRRLGAGLHAQRHGRLGAGLPGHSSGSATHHRARSAP